MQMFVGMLMVFIASFFFTFFSVFVQVIQGKIKRSNPVFYGKAEIFSGYKTEAKGTIQVDVDIKYENCVQAIFQMCQTLQKVCGNDFVKVWGWTLQANSPVYDVLDSSDYTIVNGTYVSTYGKKIQLKNVPYFSGFNLGTISNCSDVNVPRQWGANYYVSYVRPLGCDDFVLNLEGGLVDVPCGLVNFLGTN